MGSPPVLFGHRPNGMRKAGTQEAKRRWISVPAFLLSLFSWELSCETRNQFPSDQVIDALPLADQVGLAAGDQHLRGQRHRVVVRAHHERVRPGTVNREEVADLGPRQSAGPAEPPVA